jgi:hypothetical protein
LKLRTSDGTSDQVLVSIIIIGDCGEASDDHSADDPGYDDDKSAICLCAPFRQDPVAGAVDDRHARRLYLSACRVLRHKFSASSRHPHAGEQKRFSCEAGGPKSGKI